MTTERQCGATHKGQGPCILDYAHNTGKPDIPENHWDGGLPVSTSGDKQLFDSGAVRDSQDGKPRYDLIDPAFLFRLAEVMRKGATHYGEFNWTKGIPSQRYAASLLRHTFAYLAGERDEDHLAAAAFNLMGLMRNEGTDLDDLFDWGQS